MFYNFLKKQTLIILLTLIIIPKSIYAYSDYVVASGKTVGIKLKANGIVIVGAYDIDNHNALKESELKIGDLITKIDDNSVSSIEDMVDVINTCNCTSIKLSYLRDNNEYNTKLNLYMKDNLIKTGLYVKDSISGVGTLTFIDPKSKIFGVLGHEIISEDIKDIINIQSGNIFDSKITSITKSSRGDPGEKNAILYTDKISGNIYENTKKGVFGKYIEDISGKELYKVGSINDIKIGSANILTSINDDKVEKFSINILSVKKTSDNLKNIEFEITDEKLLKNTNGIVQGMSGSPIIQDEKIIGAVTHVVVENPHRGYGILITNMLEEAEN